MSPQFKIAWTRKANRQLEQLVAARFESGLPIKVVNDSLNFVLQLLQRDPFAAGESREGDLRIVFLKPLRITIRVVVSERKVILKDIFDYQRKQE